MRVVYDAGVLIGADGNDRRTWADHKARLEQGIVPVTTAPVVAQASRSPRQVQLRRLLRGCQIVAFAPDDAHRVGALLGVTGTSDIVDAHVALVASDLYAEIWTSDPGDLRDLARQTDRPPAVRRT